MTNGENGGASMWRLLSIVAPIVTAINLGVAGWLIVQIVDVQSSRFTAEDGLDVWREISAIRVDLAGKADRDEVPPDEVVRWLERLESYHKGNR